jgi:hypothetical protein
LWKEARQAWKEEMAGWFGDARSSRGRWKRASKTGAGCRAELRWMQDRDLGRQHGSDKGEGGGSWDHDNGKNAGRRIQMRQHGGKQWKARVDRQPSGADIGEGLSIETGIGVGNRSSEGVNRRGEGRARLAEETAGGTVATSKAGQLVKAAQSMKANTGLVRAGLASG